MPAQLLHPLEPVADRVAVGEQLVGGRGHVAVVVEVGLDRLHQVGLVLLVVGRQRGHGLVVEALELVGVLAHRRQQQPVGARVLEGEQLQPVGLGDVRRQLRLLAGPVEVDRVGDPAAAGDGDVEARQRGGDLARQRGRRPLELRRLLGRHHGAHLRPRRRPRRAARSRPGPRRAARAARRSAPAPASRRPARPAAPRGRRSPRRPASSLLPSSAPRARMSPRSVTRRAEQRGDELARRLVARPLRRPRALELERQQRRHHPHQGRRGVARRDRGSAARRRRASATRSSIVSTPPLAGEQLRSPRPTTRPRPPAPRSSGRSAPRSRPAPAPAARATAGSPAPDSIASESACSERSSPAFCRAFSGLGPGRHARILGCGRARAAQVTARLSRTGG